MAFSLKKRAGKTDSAVRAERVPPKGKIFKPAKGMRYVIFIGDEGAILVQLEHNTVVSRQFAPDAAQQNLEEFKQTLAKHPKAPVMLVVDSMDQSYVQQTLPPISAMSVGKLIKRRLERDFPGNDIKGALVLGRDKTGRKDWNFMMVALERSQQLSAWINFLMELPNRFQGIYLVSVETEALLKTLERGLGISKEDTGAEWKFFVSHNKVGGFRQVILRNGRIIFTRLAQPLADSNTEVIAGSIEQEMLSTIEYMKRLGFNPQAGLDVYIVASEGMKAFIDVRKFNATSAQIFTPFEIAQMFGIEGATQPTDQFGDVVLAAIIGSSRKHILTLSVPQYGKVDSCYKLITAQRALAVLSVLGMMGYMGSMGMEILTFSGNIDDLERQKRSEEGTLQALRRTVSDSKLDVEKASDLIDLYKQLKEEKTTPLPFIVKLAPLIKSPLALKSIEWSLADEKTMMSLAAIPSDNNNPADNTAAMPAVQGTGGIPMIVNLVVELPPVAIESKARRLIMSKVLADFRGALKGYKVISERGAKESEQQAELYKMGSAKKAAEGQSGQPAAPVAEKAVEEKIIITGMLPAVKPSAPSAAVGAKP